MPPIDAGPASPDTVPKMIELPIPAATAALASWFDAATPDRARLYAVLEGRAPGRVLVDRMPGPSFAIVRSAWFGRVFLAGDELAEGLRALRRDGPVHLDLGDALARRFPSGAVETLPRLEFCRPLAQRDDLRERLARPPAGCEVRAIDAAAFEACRWKQSLLGVFASAEDYLARSLGFGLYRNAELVCEAHAFFWGGGLVEIGAITAPEERGRGHAAFTAAQLVTACEARGITTYWGCDVANAPSARVARKLGYGAPRPYSIGYYPALPAEGGDPLPTGGSPGA
jgi:RimJ/RimL family protein N-acetyltransferase